MRLALLFISLILFCQKYTNGQTEIIKSKTIDSLNISPIRKLLILEPIIPYDDRIIRNTMKSAIVEEIDTIIDFHFIENDQYIAKSQNSFNININDIIKSEKDFDAILIVIYSNIVIYDYSLRGMFIPLAPYPVTDNMSKVQMFLVNKKGAIIRKRSKTAWSADRFGVTKNPLRGIKNITMLSTYSMIKKITQLNKNLF